MNRSRMTTHLWFGLGLGVILASGCEETPPPGRALPQAAAAEAQEPMSQEPVSQEEPMAEEKAASSGEAAAQHKFTNDLIHETSPYLLQHAHNPVNWHPWGEAAFKLAKEQNKPVFLSVGYSTCYWCHVMERESFEDEEVAKILNEHFICIKVDREERPDVDEQYMLATQIFTGRGGWPNSLWLMPDGRPWMAGTYFPREGFMQGLEKLAALWKEQPEAIEKQAESFAEAIKKSVDRLQTTGEGELSRKLVDQSLDLIKSNFDEEHGGFGTRPKFPPHGDLRLLLREAERSGDKALLGMATQTLDAIWNGGIHDHLGGGFHRYATDAIWFLPHFEKMLYDNAQLMRSYTDAAAITGEPRYRAAVADIFRWVEREMTHPDGGFYSALDAGDKGEEGVFYVWKHDEIVKVLGEEDAKLFAATYGIQEEGNWVEEATQERPGTNIPFLSQMISQEDDEKLAPLRAKLLQVRNKRAFPRRDDKILASWNGLMISALAHAGLELDEPRYTQSAAKAAEFLQSNLIKNQGLQRSWREGKAKLPGYLDDYAYVIDGLLELHAATKEQRWLDLARQLSDTMLAEFADPSGGGFFFTSGKHAELLARSKSLAGGGNLPSANGIAAMALLRLGKLTGDQKYTSSAEGTLNSLADLMARSPGASETLILATAALLDEMPPPVASNADVRNEEAPVTAELYASRLSLQPGESLEIALKLTIAEGWHLYGPNPGVKFVLPTTLALAENASAAHGEIKYPPGEKKDDPVLKESVAIYTGEVWLRVPVSIAKDATLGPTTLQFKLRTQACDETKCLQPRTTTLSLPIEIVETSTEELRHREVFKSETSP
jgi:uncharacterized protein YyaL (SSP411 family)